MNKKWKSFLMILCICFLLMGTDNQLQAASGGTAVSVSSGSVNIGETVTVTAQAKGPAGERTVATMSLSYDANVLQFVSCSTTYGGGGGSVTATSDNFTVTLKAVAAGNSAISLSASDGVVFDTNEELEAMSGSSTSVTVNNAASSGGTDAGNSGNNNAGGGNEGGGSTNGSGSGNGGQTGGSDGSGAVLSADNSLKSLALSEGTLSPAFSGKTTNYSASVENNIINIAVSAVPANEKATVESVSGNNNLAVGKNTISVVVRAENGVTATYKIELTRKSAENQPSSEKSTETETEIEEEVPDNAGTITVNGQAYEISEEFAKEEIPENFSETTVNYHGSDYKGVSYDKGTLVMLSLKKDGDESTNSFFIYDEARDSFYPFIRLGTAEKYVIAMLAPIDFIMPETYIQTSVLVDEENSISAYQITSETQENEDFYIFYAVNSEGDEGWYQYDAVEGTYQRLNVVTVNNEEADVSSDEYLSKEYAALSELYTKEKAFARNMIALLIFIIVVLAIIVINLIIRRKGKDDNFPNDFDDKEGSEDINDEFDETEDANENSHKMFGLFRRKKEDTTDEFQNEMEDGNEETYLDEDLEDDFPEDDLSDWNIQDEPVEKKVILKNDSPMNDSISAVEKTESKKAAPVQLTEEEEEKLKMESLRKQFFAEEDDAEAHGVKKRKEKKAKKDSEEERREIEIMDFNDL